MIYFLALQEGGKFIKVMDYSKKPENIVRFLKKQFKDIVVVFKCGMVYDDNIKKGRTKWRHVLWGGRKYGKKLYQELLLNVSLSMGPLCDDS